MTQVKERLLGIHGQGSKRVVVWEGDRDGISGNPQSVWHVCMSVWTEGRGVDRTSL